MRTKTKALALALCAVLLVVTTVFVTMAYLTSTTDVVTNTFTVGKVTITLDEAKVDEYGKEVEGEDRVDANTYKLIPGHTYTKDPTVHVTEGSENCWLFVKVENGLEDIIDAETIGTQMSKNGWSLVDGETNIYAYSEIATAETRDYKVFNNFKIKGEAAVDSYNNKNITIQAYAIQADGFATAADAWTAAPSNWQTPAN